VFLAGPVPSRAGLAPDLGESLARTVAGITGRGAGATSVSLISGGHAGGLLALERALAMLRAGAAEACLVGAADSWFFPDTLEAMDGANRFKSRKNPWGFIPGEAAAFCLLCTEATAERAQIKVRGRVLEIGLSEEHSTAVPGAVNTGEGLWRAVRAAIDVLPNGTSVDEVMCDLNGARDRADELGFLFARLGQRLGGEVRFWAPATSWGDIGAASAITAITTAVVVAERGFPRGPHVLVTAGSEGGLRGAALLHLPPMRRDEDV
jgi:3-oxoacyl-[acyl-carrier-protein] synthase-1